MRVLMIVLALTLVSCKGEPAPTCDANVARACVNNMNAYLECEEYDFDGDGMVSLTDLSVCVNR